MKTPLYRQAIQHGWQLAWRQRWLWIFGLFAAFLGQLGIVEFLSKISLATSDVEKYLTDLGLVGQTNPTAVGGGASAGQGDALYLWLLVLLLGLVIALLFVAVVSQGALIHSAAQAAQKRKSTVDLGRAWQAGVSHFWRLFFINVVKKGLLVILAVVVAAAALSAVHAPSLGNGLQFLLIFILACIVGLVLSFLVIYAAAYVVVEEYALGQAVAAAWRLFVDHWLVSLEVGLLTLLFNLVAFVLSLLGFLIFFYPTMLVWVVAIAVSSQWLLAAGFIIALLLFTAYLMWLGSVFTVFITAVWTYLFMKMHQTGIKSRVLHWLAYKQV